MQARKDYRNFEQTLHLLMKKTERQRISIQALLTILFGQGKVLLLMFLSLGFCQIPGIAMILGLFIAYLGVRISMGKSSIWLPKFVLKKKIPSFFLNKIIRQTLQMLHFIKRWSMPRYAWAAKNGTRIVNGVAIACVGLCLASSPPIPLTGLLGSLAIFLIGIGLLNLDGLYTALGYTAAFLYFILVLVMIRYVSISQIVGWIQQAT